MRNTIATLLVLALLAGTANAATFSILPLDASNQWQDPAGLVLDNLRGGFTINPVGEFGERDIKSNRDNAQSFTITSATIIDKVAINFAETLSDGGSTTFEFFAVADANAATLTPLGGIIDSVTFTSATLGVGTNDAGTLIFDVVDTVAAANSAFAIRFDTASSMTTRTVKWEHFDANETGYPGGAGYQANAPTVGRDYTLGVVAVPEPATMSLLVLGGLGVLLRRRSRKA